MTMASNFHLSFHVCCRKVNTNSLLSENENARVNFRTRISSILIDEIEEEGGGGG